jgi:hypothetical protein
MSLLMRHGDGRFNRGLIKRVPPTGKAKAAVPKAGLHPGHSALLAVSAHLVVTWRTWLARLAYQWYLDPTEFG